MKCKRCNRELKNKDSVIKEYGPCCYKKLYGTNVSFKIKRKKVLKNQKDITDYWRGEKNGKCK